MPNEPVNRTLKISILRFNPQEPESVPRMVTYELEEAENMTLFIALSEIREKQEPSLQFDFVCRAGIGRNSISCSPRHSRFSGPSRKGPKRMSFANSIRESSVNT